MEEEKYDEKEYVLANDWKFVSIVQFVNVFKNVLAVDSISTFELEFSLKYPECEPLCLNILLKLLMKKALFKPNCKVFENFEFSKLQEMLLKKINYFYKTYIRYLKRIYELTDNNKIYEIIKKDVTDFNQKTDRFNLTSVNLDEKDYDDLDLKNSMIIEFFRNLSGRNPFLKNTIQVDNMENYLNMDDDNKEVNVHNIEEINPNNYNTNEMDPYMHDYKTFNDLSIKDKIEILFFFCNYALTFSGRAPLFKEELTKEPLEPPVFTQDSHGRIKPIGKDAESNFYYILFINRDCRLYKETISKGVELVVKNYDELEKFITKYESSKNPNEANLVKNIKDNLLKFKENDEEEKKRESNLIRKQQAFEKAKKLTGKGNTTDKNQNSDFYLMNISDHMITRHQLNQITKTTSLNNFQSALPIPKQPTITEQDRLRMKIEKERIERQKRLEKRQKLIEMTQFDDNPEEASEKDDRESFTRTKRTRLSQRITQRRVVKKNRRNSLSSESEFISGSVSMERSSNLDLASDRDDNIEYAENRHYSEGNSANDIVLEGSLIYRYLSNQIELEGNWFMSLDPGVKERLSYLLLKNNEFTECMVNCDEDDEKSENECDSKDNKKPSESSYHNMKIKICSANLFECILINKAKIFNAVLEYLDSEYAGYFMYYGKTIEDRFGLSFELQDSLVKINGEGTNSLGNFSLIGYMNFYRSKDVLLEKNDLDADFIKLAEFKLTKIYTEFNPNENYRVIKSYQHRRKKLDDDLY